MILATDWGNSSAGESSIISAIAVAAARVFTADPAEAFAQLKPNVELGPLYGAAVA
jgi:hypothetical protein